MIKNHFRILIISAVLVPAAQLSYGENEPVSFEAESGTAGSEFSFLTEEGVEYAAVETDLVNGDYPGSAERIITFEIEFFAAGEYDLYCRLKVGPDAASDDSFFYAAGFGAKDENNADDWITINNLNSAGFAADEAYVTGEGSIQAGIWKWINLSEFTGQETPVSFTVEEASTLTFQVGGREDGLEIDKFAFAPSELYYTVSNLDNGEPGVEELPDPDVTPPIADGQDKFLGNVYSVSQAVGFTNYWNQVTPENAGKWGSVEPQRDVMNWSELDAAYALAKDNGFPYRHHVLIWGNQQPSWIEELDSAAQREEIEAWFESVATRYPDIDQVEVVNEPLHDPPQGDGNGNYLKALGGAGDTGWDWIIEAFRLARDYFPEAKLLINDYNIVNSAQNTQDYKEIIELLQAEDLIDLIGVQAHAFSTRGSAAGINANLNVLAETGLPIMVTELDIDGPTDAIQLQDYQKIFPVLWEHPAVEGVTLWGFRPGMWRTEEGAYLIEQNGATERPALVWLKAYVSGSVVEISGVEIQSDANSVDAGNTLSLSVAIAPEDATIQAVEWSVEPEPGSSGEATIDENGLLTAVKPGQVIVTASAIDGSGVTAELSVDIQGALSVSKDWRKATLYPNPAWNGQFTIKGIERTKSIQALDLTGNIIKEWTISGQSTLDIGFNGAPGVYLIRLSDGRGATFKKVIIK